MRTHGLTGRRGRVAARDWALVDDPDAWRQFIAEVVDRHHRVASPGSVADQCSCGRPFMLCSIAPLAEALIEQAQPVSD